MLTEALADAATDPATIGVLEAHGTGTSLGDPIELRALATAFGDAAKPESCALGSVKSNIGHAEGAAGISGLTKAVLQLHHRTLAPTLHADPANPLLELDSSPFRIQYAAEEWTVPDGGPRRAGVSSFGATGANAHVVLEEYTGPREAAAATSAPGPVVVPLSARTVPALRAVAERLLDRLRGGAADPVREVTARLARVLGTDPADLDPRQPWHEYGITAAEVTQVARSLAELLPSGRPPRLTAGHTVAEAAALVPAGAGDLALADVAHTLRHGRVELAERAAFAVPDLAGLVRALGDFLADDRVRVHGTEAALRPSAERWVEGAAVDWTDRPGAARGRRVSLPGYPFAQDRYWFTDHSAAPVGNAASPAEAAPGSAGQPQEPERGPGQHEQQGQEQQGQGQDADGAADALTAPSPGMLRVPSWEVRSRRRPNRPPPGDGYWSSSPGPVPWPRPSAPTTAQPGPPLFR
ncbi:hypothetical protein IHE61_30130 [Streptomyces sp. GKU 257-1]|nr:hypothetical protein [Streptomyces sp. GKU 257-1]